MEALFENAEALNIVFNPCLKNGNQHLIFFDIYIYNNIF